MSKHDKPETLELTTQDVAMVPAPSTTDIATRNESYLAPFRKVLEGLLTVDEDPTPRMMNAIMMATNMGEFEQLFDAAHFKNMDGHKIRVTAIRAAESTYENSRLGMFLVCDITDLETGEERVMTCGSEISMAQLLKCHVEGWLPADFQIITKDTPTKAGFKPMRLRALARNVTPDAAG